MNRYIILFIAINSFYPTFSMQPKTISDLPSDMLKHVIQQALYADLPQPKQYTSEAIQDIEDRIKLTNVNTQLLDVSGRYVYNQNLIMVLTGLKIFLTDIQNDSQAMFNAITQQIASLVRADKQLRNVTIDQVSLQTILQAITDQLKQTYFFKGATILHTAVLLSAHPKVKKWLQDSIELYKPIINNATQNGFMLTPLLLAKILKEQDLVNLITQHGGTVEQKALQRLLSEYYHSTLTPQPV